MDIIDRESLVADYLNDKLDEQAKAEFETRVATDEQLASELLQAKALREALNYNQDTMADPSFSAFSEKLEKATPWYSKWYNLVPLPAAALAVFLVVTPQTEVNEFETLTSPGVSYDVPALRLVIDSDTDLNALTKDYNLTILDQVTVGQGKSVHVSFKGDIDSVARQLEQDPRIMLVKPIGE